MDLTDPRGIGHRLQFWTRAGRRPHIGATGSPSGYQQPRGARSSIGPWRSSPTQGRRWSPFRGMFASSTTWKSWYLRRRNSWDLSISWVANGGGPRVKPATELDETDWADAIPLALLFVPRLCNLVLPGMRRRGWGRIVAINSVSARQPIPRLALSNALRPARPGLSQDLGARGWQPTASTVNAACSPAIHAPSGRSSWRVVWPNRQARARPKFSPPRAVISPSAGWPNPHEIGEMIGFLCSPGASYVTGQFLAVEGGYLRGI